MPDLELTSTAFEDGEPIPVKHTGDGEGSSPPLVWDSVPDGTRSLALIVHDPDAPSGDFTHWLAWNIDPEAGGLEEGASAPAEGTHGFGGPGYTGPSPPQGHGPHRYFFHLYALDAELDLEPGVTREQLEAEIQGHVLAEAQLMGTYERR
jgi:Raf kinase inhibitor-like YbhB/YbcL family protein